MFSINFSSFTLHLPGEYGTPKIVGLVPVADTIVVILVEAAQVVKVALCVVVIALRNCKTLNRYLITGHNIINS